ncbi:MAG: glutamate--tRNA ligase [Bradymonadales bacterium]|nr:glutamate--tRNA ligase [Bradymonadales bacterium]
MTIRVRFAPSPTGHLHLGGARTALFNWLYARHHSGQFLLRIEDTDRARSTEESTAGILEALQWLHMDWDEPPLIQSTRYQAHVQAAHELVEKGGAYRCYCDAQTLEQMREDQRRRGEKPRYDRRCLDRPRPAGDQPFAIRFLTPREGVVEIEDLVKGPVQVHNDELDDLIILRSDGTPTYNFSVVMDDGFMGITHVIRGDDHLNNTFRQYHIYRALGFETPRFGHLPLIKGLSKRLGSASVQAYRDKGYLWEAVLNYIARLGWAHGDDEIFSQEELIAKFDLKGVAKSPAAFDEDKMTWLNQHYLKTLPEETVAERLLPVLAQREYPGVAQDGRLLALVRALRERARTLIDMADSARFAYLPPEGYDPKATQKWIDKKTLENLAVITKNLEELEVFGPQEIESLIRQHAEEQGMNLGQVAQPIRICLTGSAVSPPLFDTMLIIGKEEVIQRLGDGIRKLAPAVEQH